MGREGGVGEKGGLSSKLGDGVDIATLLFANIYPGALRTLESFI